MSNDSGEVQTSNQGSVEEVCQYVLEISVSTFYSCTDELGKLAENKAQYDAYMRGACRKLVGKGFRALGYADSVITISIAALERDVDKIAEEIFKQYYSVVLGIVGGIVGAYGAPKGLKTEGAVIGAIAGSAAGGDVGAWVYGNLKKACGGGGTGGGGGAGGQKDKWVSSKNDPLALDLDGNGIGFTKNSTYFDMGTDGFAEKATWIGKGDGLLTLDINGDGKINNGSELFGDAMKKKDGTLAKDGFDALTDYDMNKDGKIDADDDIYSKLKVWVDANGDGITDAGELKTLAELGIKQLNLGNTVVNGADQPTGEAVRKQGTFVWENGSQSALNAYALSRDAVDSKETELLPVPDDVKALPDVRGWGNVHSLQQAMVRDASGELKALVVSFANATGITEREQLTEKIMLKWCGADKVDPNSRGGCFDARQLAALEKLFGEPYLGGHGANPNQYQAPILKEIYSKLADELYCELLTKTTALQFIIQPTVDINGKTIGYNLDYAKQMLDGIIAIDQNAGLELLGNYWRVCKAYGYADATNTDCKKYVDFYNGYYAKGGDYLVALFSAAAGNGKMFSDNGYNVIYGTEANIDVVYGTAKNDVIFGLGGGDQLYGFDGDDILVGGDGDDIMIGAVGNDIICGGDGDDTASGGIGNDKLYGGAGNDTLAGDNGDDYIEGGIGDDDIRGGLGNDILYGNSGADIIRGGKGADMMYGGSGSDQYLFATGDGADVISEYDDTGTDVDTAVFDVTREELLISHEGNDVVIRYGNSDKIAIRDWYASESNQIEEFHTSDGYLLLKSNIDTMIQTMAAFEKNNGMSWQTALTERTSETQTILNQFWVKE